MTGFVKGDFHTSNLLTLTISNFRLVKAIDLKSTNIGYWLEKVSVSNMFWMVLQVHEIGCV